MLRGPAGRGRTGVGGGLRLPRGAFGRRGARRGGALRDRLRGGLRPRHDDPHRRLGVRAVGIPHPRREAAAARRVAGGGRSGRAVSGGGGAQRISFEHPLGLRRPADAIHRTGRSRRGAGARARAALEPDLDRARHRRHGLGGAHPDRRDHRAGVAGARSLRRDGPAVCGAQPGRGRREGKGAPPGRPPRPLRDRSGDRPGSAERAGSGDGSGGSRRHGCPDGARGGGGCRRPFDGGHHRNSAPHGRRRRRPAAGGGSARAPLRGPYAVHRTHPRLAAAGRPFLRRDRRPGRERRGPPHPRGALERAQRLSRGRPRGGPHFQRGRPGGGRNRGLRRQAVCAASRRRPHRAGRDPARLARTGARPSAPSSPWPCSAA